MNEEYIMRKRKLIWLFIFVAILLFAALSPVYGGDPARTGTAGGEQLLVPVGARDLAMGGANIAMTTGLDAIYWNPAGFSSMQNRAAGLFSTMNIFEDIRISYLAVGVAAGNIGHIGVSIKTFDFGDIPVTTNADMDGASGQTFSPNFFTLGLTYSKRLTDAIQVGVTGKVISESIPRANASAYAFDVGIQYHQLGGIDGLSVGFAVKNIGTDLNYEGGGLVQQFVNPETGLQEFTQRSAATHTLPANFELGVGYKREVAENNTVRITGIFQNNDFGNDSYSFGGEYAYSDLIAVRGGYRFYDGIDAEDVLYKLTLGVGLHYKLGATDVTFDYAYRDSQYFNGNNMFSIKIGF